MVLTPTTLHSYATYVFGRISRTLRTPDGSRSATCVFGRIEECIARPVRGRCAGYEAMCRRSGGCLEAVGAT